MATTLSKTSSFVGEAAREYLLRTFAEASSLRDNILTVKENVHKSWKIRRLAATGLIADKSCDFTAAGTVTINERSLTPADLEVNLELCKDNFKNDWDGANMGRGANNKSLTPELVDAVVNQVNGSIGEALETMIYQGDTSGTDQFDGFIKLALADATVVDVTAATGAFIAAPLTKMAAIKEKAVAAKIAMKEDFVYIMSPTNAEALMAAYRSAGSGQENISGDVPLRYNGAPVHVSYGMPDANIIAARKSNLYFGTDLQSDWNEVIVKDMSEIDLSDNVRFKLVATGGVNYGWGEEFILYTES